MALSKAKRMEFFKTRVPMYQVDPVLFATEILHFYPDLWQREVLTDLATAKKVSVRSGHGVGKTGVESVALLWFICCFKFAKIIATAPTRQQLNDVLWSEVDKWRSNSPILTEILEWTKTYCYMKKYDKRWFAVARTAVKPENMQGFHEDSMMIIVDEASGVRDEIMEAILATLTGCNNKLLLCGNPTRMSGVFYDSHNSDKASYCTHKVSSMDSERTNKESIASFIRKYGKDSNVVKVRVYGEFPTQEDDAYIPITLVEKAVITELDSDIVDKITLGVDVARYGDDDTAIARNVSGNISIPIVRHGQNLMSTVGEIVNEYHNLVAKYPKYRGPITVNIDDTGLGGGVTDRLDEVKREQKLNRMVIVPINFAMKPPQDGSEIRYNDISTYMWASIRTLMEAEQLKLPDDSELVAQLTVRKYSINSQGRIALESKADMKKRGIGSPDLADAVALSCYATDKIYGAMLVNAEAVMISLAEILKYNMVKISIGISAGSSKKGVSMVATAITQGYGKVIALASKHFDGQIETEGLSKEFVGFCTHINETYGFADYAYCDSDGNILLKSIKTIAERNNLGISVRNNADAPVNDRIRTTVRLMKQQRVLFTDECHTLKEAFTSAVWSEKKSADGRDTSTDIGTLNAFEYTIEREMSRFITMNGEGEDEANVQSANYKDKAGVSKNDQ